MPDKFDSDSRGPVQLDRILLGACAVVWLAALGAGVAAGVTLSDMGSAHAESSHSTPWPLYTVIAVSAAVIIGAVPLLLRARRGAAVPSVPVFGAESGASSAAPAPVGRNVEPGFGEAATTKLRSFNDPAVRGYSASPAHSMVGFPVAAVDQWWLRSTVGIATAMGAATLFVFLATYVMADAHDALSWMLYGLAGLCTAAMVVIPWYCLRELRAALGAAAESSRAA